MPPKVLVLMAAYNGSQWIGEQIDSILRQANVDLDLIVSDDASSDGTRSEVERYTTDRRVKIISHKAPSGSAAKNFLWLFRATVADHYAFAAIADQDDIWHEQKLIRACSALTDTAASGYSCAVTAFWESGREILLSQADKRTQSDYLFEGAGQGCSYVLTTRLYTRLRAFFLQHMAHTAQLHYHDWAIYALSRSWDLPWIFDGAPMLRYRQHARNDTGARWSTAGLTRRIRLIRNGWYARQLNTIAEICGAATSLNPVVLEWNRLLSLPRGLMRQYSIARFCMRGGRRRRSDNVVLIGAAVLGWI
jgi:rhamnosyltransferase